MSASSINPRQLIHCSPEELGTYLGDAIDTDWLCEYVLHQQQQAKEELAEELAAQFESVLTITYAAVTYRSPRANAGKLCKVRLHKLQHTDFTKFLAERGNEHEVLGRTLHKLGVD